MPNAERVFHEKIEHRRIPRISREETASDVFRVIGMTVAFVGLAWGVAWMVSQVIKPGIKPRNQPIPKDWEPITDLGSVP